MESEESKIFLQKKSTYRDGFGEVPGLVDVAF